MSNSCGAPSRRRRAPSCLRYRRCLWKAYAAGHGERGRGGGPVGGHRAETGAPGPSEARPAPSRLAAEITCHHGKTPPVGRLRGLPPPLASRFTLAEQAVLAVIAAEHVKHGRCTLTIDHIAALAGVSRARPSSAPCGRRSGTGWCAIEERRLSAWRNAPNVVTITSPEWTTWLRMRGGGWGQIREPPRIQENKKGTSALRNGRWAAEGQGAGGRGYEIRERQTGCAPDTQKAGPIPSQTVDAQTGDPQPRPDCWCW